MFISFIGTSPFKEGLIVVMDGMGETYKAMAEDMSGLEEHSGFYFTLYHLNHTSSLNTP
jgi:predicted NodU family carbamoyl transferase